MKSALRFIIFCPKHKRKAVWKEFEDVVSTAGVLIVAIVAIAAGMEIAGRAELHQANAKRGSMTVAHVPSQSLPQRAFNELPPLVPIIEKLPRDDGTDGNGRIFCGKCRVAALQQVSADNTKEADTEISGHTTIDELSQSQPETDESNAELMILFEGCVTKF